MTGPLRPSFILTWDKKPHTHYGGSRFFQTSCRPKTALQPLTEMHLFIFNKKECPCCLFQCYWKQPQKSHRPNRRLTHIRKAHPRVLQLCVVMRTSLVVCVQVHFVVLFSIFSFVKQPPTRSWPMGQSRMREENGNLFHESASSTPRWPNGSWKVRSFCRL